MITIDFTFQTVTPESAEYGDFDSHGFITPGMWKFPLSVTGNDLNLYERNVWAPGDLAGLISFAQSLGIRSDGDSFYSVDPDIDYRTGEDTTYAMHIDGATVSTMNRIHNLLR